MGLIRKPCVPEMIGFIIACCALGCREEPRIYTPGGRASVEWLNLSGQYEQRCVFAPGKTTEEAGRAALERFQQQMLSRPEFPGFRTLCGVLNRDVPTWSRLILLEKIHPQRNPPDAPQEYGFVLAIDGPDGGFVVTTGRKGGRVRPSFEDQFGVAPRAARPGWEGVSRCFSSVEQATRELPSVYLTSFSHETPLWALHYFAEGSYWFCAMEGWGPAEVEEPGREPVATTAEVRKVLWGHEAPSKPEKGLPWIVVLDRSQEDVYFKIARRYASVMGEVWRLTEH